MLRLRRDTLSRRAVSNGMKFFVNGPGEVPVEFVEGDAQEDAYAYLAHRVLAEWDRLGQYDAALPGYQMVRVPPFRYAPFKDALTQDKCIRGFVVRTAMLPIALEKYGAAEYVARRERFMKWRAELPDDERAKLFFV